MLVVSGRETIGSGGELNPFHQEHDDGVAVLAWLSQQPWFTGVLGTAGASYLGYTQWAKLNAVKVVRENGQTILVDVDAVLNKGRLEKDVLLEPGDLIIVPERGVVFGN